MEACGLTKAQAVGFMHWARGQVRRPSMNLYRCIVEPGIETRWLRFQAVTEHAEPVHQQALDSPSPVFPWPDGATSFLEEGPSR